MFGVGGSCHRLALGAGLLLGALHLFACSQEAGWSSAEELDPRSPASHTALVTGGDGSTLAVWRGPNPESNPTLPRGFEGLFARWKRAGGGWGPVSVLDDYESLPLEPAAAAGPSGEGIVVWGQRGELTEPDEVWASRYGPAAGWGAPEAVGDGRFRETPRAAVGPAGEMFVAWSRRTSTGQEIALSEHQANAGWIGRETLSLAAGQDEVTLLGLAVDRGGRVIAVYWSGTIGTGVNRFTPEAGWGSPSTFEQDDLVGPPMAEVDVQGTVWAFWPGLEVNGSCEGAVRNTSDDGWEALTRFETGCAQGTGGAIAVDHVGGAVAIWGQGYSEDATAFWSRYRAGQGWTPPESAPVGEGFGPTVWDLGALRDGQAAALWYRRGIEGSEFGGGQFAVWTSALGAGNQWTDPQRLTERGPWASVSDARFVPPRIVTHEDGRAVGLWIGYSVPPTAPQSELRITPWWSERR